MTTVGTLTGMVADELELRGALEFTLSDIRARCQAQVDHQVEQDRMLMPHNLRLPGPLEAPRKWAETIAAVLVVGRTLDQRAERDRRAFLGQSIRRQLDDRARRAERGW